MAQVSNGNNIVTNSFGDFTTPNYNHVTVVQVEETEPKSNFNDEFVTVLQVGDETEANHSSKSIEEEITIYRLPGERLGMALKFEGGTNASEKINKVFIQSINTDSPASKAHGQELEFLKESDQIMQIDGKLTSSMTRLECIALLRDAPVCIKIRVKRELSCHCLHSLSNIKLNANWNQSEMPNSSLSRANSTVSLKKVPPPVPPRMATTILSSKRKIVSYSQTQLDSDSIEKPPRKKCSQPPPLPPRRPKVPPPEPPKEKEIKCEQNLQNIDQMNEQNIIINESENVKSEATCLLSNSINDTNRGKDRQLEENRVIEPILPSEPSVYLDLFADEDIMHDNSELSDDTGSSVSTIIERFSRTSTANSSFSDNINRKTPTIDIGSVLSPFEELERELDHKEALQAFVNKASVLIVDEDLREITDENLCHNTYDVSYDVDDYCDPPNLDFLNKNLQKSCPSFSDKELSPNVQIIVPPEEFCNREIDLIDSKQSQTIPSKSLQLSTKFKSSSNHIDSDAMDGQSNSDSELYDFEIIESIILSDCVKTENELDLNEKEAQLIERKARQLEKELKNIDNIICVSDNKINSTENTFLFSENQPKQEVNESIKENENNSYIDQIEKAFKCIEEDIVVPNGHLESIERFSEKNNEKSTKNTDELNGRKRLIEETDKDYTEDRTKMTTDHKKRSELLQNIVNSRNESELNMFENINGFNRKIDTREDTHTHEESIECLRKHEPINGVKSEHLECETNSNLTTKYLANGGNDILMNSNFNAIRSDEEREKSVHTNSSNKNSSIISLIPKRLPTIKPRKAKSHGNIPSLYFSSNTPDKKPSLIPSLIPRPVSRNISLINNRNDTLKNSQNMIKVQNSKHIQNSKSKTSAERKKNEVLSSYSFESKIPVNLKSTIKCESLMDLTTSFTTTDIENSISGDDSVELIQSPQNESLELTETNQTESSLQSKKLNNNISGTESESEVDSFALENQIDIIESIVQQQNLITDEIVETSLTPTSHTFTSLECVDESQIEIINKEEEEEEEEVEGEVEDQLDMIRVRKPHDLIEISMDSTCLPPTYARQPPDGREITLNCVDLHLPNVNDSNIPPLSSEIFQMQTSVHEDSGVFIDNDSPSPELDFSVNSISRGPNVSVTRIKYKSNNDNSSDADTGVMSMSSDSMDELDSGPLPNLKLKKQLMGRTHSNPSSASPMETASNGFANNANNNSNKSNSSFNAKHSDMNKSVKERIAMFDLQRNDSLENNEERKESLKVVSKNTSFKSDPPLIERTLNYESSTLNAKNELTSETNSSSLSTADKSQIIADKQCKDKNNDTVENGSIYNMKSTFMPIKSSSISSNISDNISNSKQTIQENITNTSTQYTGHLQPSYLRFSSLGSTNETSYNSNSYPGIGVHKPLLNGSLLSSILETRKQNASKLKGLIIPDIPITSQPSVSKALPTIFSNTSTSSTLLTSKPEEVSSLTQKQSLHQSQNQSNLSPNLPLQRQSLLSDPPWIATSNPSIPKYSPAFKRRQLELPRSLSLLNNVTNDTINSSNPNFNRSNSITALNDSQFHFSLSHSKPVIPLMPETAIISPNIDGINNTSINTLSIEKQMVINLNEPYRHSSIQRRYSADVCNNNMSSLKFSLEKRSSADSVVPNVYQSPIHSLIKNDMISMQLSHNNLSSNNKSNDSMTTYSTENKIRPVIVERKSITTHNMPEESDQSIHRNISESFTDLSQEQSRDFNQFITREKLEMSQLNGNNRSFNNSTLRGLLHSDYSDDDSSTISHKTSEDSSLRADDSASDTTSDSLDHAFSPEFTRPKILGTQLTVLKNSIENENLLIKNDNNVESVKNFRALAEKWEQRSGTESLPQMGKNNPPPLPPKPSVSTNRMPPSLMPRTKKMVPNTDFIPLNVNKTNEINSITNNSFEIKQIENVFKELELDNELESALTLFDKKSDLTFDNSNDSIGKSRNNPIVSRSRSVSDICKVFECNGSENTSALKADKSLNSIKTIQMNNTNIDYESETSDSKSSDEEIISKLNQTYEEVEPQTQTIIESNINNLNSNKNNVITDIDKNFININNEEESNKLKYSEDKLMSWDKTRENEEIIQSSHQRMSSIDSIASDSGASTSGTAVRSLGLRASSVSNLRDSQYGSVTSLASTTSLISPQELQQLIDEANQSLETSDINSHNIQVVVLHREYKSNGNIGITLAGGSDCETKEITVHRVINGSLTDRDGRIRKGDRILSINGKILKGVSHKEALDIMKSPRPEVVIVLSRFNSLINSENVNGFHSRQSSSDMNELSNGNLISHSNEDMISGANSLSKENETISDSNYKVLRAELTKDVAGLGFILEGGKDSPLGDKPLAIRRIFRGGPADKEGTLASGDEVISVNDHSVHNMTRTEAWNFLKKLPEGPVILIIKRKRY